MAKVTKEKKVADFLANSMDTLDFNYPHAAFMLARYSEAIHVNLFELVLALLNHWAFEYNDGAVKAGDRMYSMCRMAARMVSSITESDRLSDRK